MNSKIFTDKQSGFSLVELMIVVGIMGLLAMMAIPRMQQFQAKAKQAEAKNMLAHVYTLEESYHLDNNTYSAFATYGRNSSAALQCVAPAGAVAIGFEISPCAGSSPRYGYAATATASTFSGTATTGAGDSNLICPGAAAHEFRTNENHNTVGPFSPGTSTTVAC